VRDLAKAAQALAQVGTTVVELRRAQLIDAETAQKLVASAAIQLGVEMDLHALREKLEQESEPRA
jgi:proteasome assembly chaperone (PAC2) family protein